MRGGTDDWLDDLAERQELSWSDYAKAVPRESGMFWQRMWNTASWENIPHTEENEHRAKNFLSSYRTKVLKMLGRPTHEEPTLEAFREDEDSL